MTDDNIQKDATEEVESVADLKLEEADAIANETRSRNDRITGSTHYGDVDFNEENSEDIRDATWSEVYETCCCHTGQEWAVIAVFMILVCISLFFFLFGLDMLGNGAKVLTGCAAGGLLSEDANPVAGLMIGILVTCLLQSSSTTTSIIVSLVGASAISTKNGIYMVMGANIGTSVTNTIVSMGFVGNGDELERAFSGATVHDMFNFLTVLVMLPIEAVTGLLYRLTKTMTPDSVEKGNKWEGPLKKIVSPLTKTIIIPNKSVSKDIATKRVESCDNFYPVNCTNGVLDYNSCKGNYGLIACDKKTGKCPAFFQNGATQKDDEISGFVVLFIGLVVLIACLVMLVTLLQKMLLGTSTRILYKATNVNGYIGIVVGMGLTILVQSSSITTSVLTPLVGIGVLHLEQMFPLTLGANIGTTFTGLMAALVSGSSDSLQVALAHLFFNIIGIAIWYPIPRMRQVPLNMAKKLGACTRIWRGFPLLYLFVAFFIIPIMLLSVSLLFDQDSKGFKVLGSIIVILILLGLGRIGYKLKYKGLKESIIKKMETRQRRNDAIRSLPDNMEYCKSEVQRLKEHTGLADEEDVEDVNEVQHAIEDVKEVEDANYDNSE